jgi:hypothetical protein
VKDEELKIIITEAIAAALKADREEFWISQPQHYMDHQMIQQCNKERDEWRKNHEFVSAIRESIGSGQKLSWKITVGAVFLFVTSAIGGAILLWISKGAKTIIN